MGNKPVIKIGHIAITDHLVLGITKHKIDYQVEKFDYCTLETEAMIGWDYVGDSLCKGEIDAAFILAPYAMELFHSGEDISLVLLGHTTESVMIKNSRLNIKTVEDFKGKTILLPFHLSIHMMLLDRLLKEHGLTVGPGKDVVFEVMAPAQIPQAMEWDENGELGGFIVAEPYGTEVIHKGFGEEFVLSKDLWPDHPCCVFVVRNEILNKHPDAIQELCNSFVKSGIFIEKKPQDAAKIGAKFLNQTVEIVEEVLTMPPDRVKYSLLKPQFEPFEIIQNYLTTEASAMSGKIDLEKFIKMEFANQSGAR